MFYIYTSTLVHWEKLRSWTAVSLFPQTDVIRIRRNDIIFSVFNRTYTVGSPHLSSAFLSLFIFALKIPGMSSVCFLGCLLTTQKFRSVFHVVRNMQWGPGQSQLSSDMSYKDNGRKVASSVSYALISWKWFSLHTKYHWKWLFKRRVAFQDCHHFLYWYKVPVLNSMGAFMNEREASWKKQEVRSLKNHSSDLTK